MTETKIYEIVDTKNQEVLNVFRQPIYVRIKKAKEEGRNIK